MLWYRIKGVYKGVLCTRPHQAKMDDADFTIYPDDWGIMVPREDVGVYATKQDVEFLAVLRAAFLDKEGNPIEAKEMEERVNIKAAKIREHLKGLWHSGYVEKFAQWLDSRSGRPSYVWFYIWGPKIDVDSEVPEFSSGEKDWQWEMIRNDSPTLLA